MVQSAEHGLRIAAGLANSIPSQLEGRKVLQTKEAFQITHGSDRIACQVQVFKHSQGFQALR